MSLGHRHSRDLKPRWSFYPTELNLGPKFPWDLYFMVAGCRQGCSGTSRSPSAAQHRCCALQPLGMCRDVVPCRDVVLPVQAAPCPASRPGAVLLLHLREKHRGTRVGGSQAAGNSALTPQASAQPKGLVSQLIIANQPLIRVVKDASCRPRS